MRIIHTIDGVYLQHCQEGLASGEKITLTFESPSGTETITGFVRAIKPGGVTGVTNQQIWDIEVEEAKSEVKP